MLSMIVYCIMCVMHFLLLGVLLVETSAELTCNTDEVPCIKRNETCVFHDLWCDGEIDCPDGSDESFCDGRSECLDLFGCANGKCIPFDAVCNGYDNCGDNSDETCTSTGNRTDTPKVPLAVVEAAHYLLSQRKSDYGWDNFTPRALIALAFAEKYLPIPAEMRSSMIKKLELQLLFLLKDGIKNLPTLALHINALYAMCKDPRDFHGIDLVELLRAETDKAIKLDFNLPIVILTLCLANDSKRKDFDQLLKIYNDERNRIGVKALALIAMSSCNSHATNSHRHESFMRMHEFTHYANHQDGNIDVYSKALISQAYNARGMDASEFQAKLLKLQSEDGSFGDLLGTYSVIPALLNTSLADLQCKTRYYKGKSRQSRASSYGQMLQAEKFLDYSIWIRDGGSSGYHTLRIRYEGNKSFFDVMKMAEERNPMYRFKYDELEDSGKMVYYLAGIPNDAERGSSWTLYREVDNLITKNVTTTSLSEKYGVDRIFPQDGEHLIFKLEHKI